MAEKCLPSFSLTHMILWRVSLSVVHFTATKTRYRANKSVSTRKESRGPRSALLLKMLLIFMHVCGLPLNVTPGCTPKKHWTALCLPFLRSSLKLLNHSQCRRRHRMYFSKSCKILHVCFYSLPFSLSVYMTWIQHCWMIWAHLHYTYFGELDH